MIADILAAAEGKMQGTIEHVKEELGGIRTGRAHPAMFNKIMVDYYGTPTPLNQVASVSIPDSRTISISPWDRNAFNCIEKAIMKSDLGLTPINDGRAIRINIPTLTEERRKDLVKLAGKYAEQQKISVRNVRRDANDDLKKAEKAGEISQDEQKKMETEVQKDTDAAIKRIDETLKTKEQEIMQV